MYKDYDNFNNDNDSGFAVTGSCEICQIADCLFIVLQNYLNGMGSWLLYIWLVLLDRIGLVG